MLPVLALISPVVGHAATAPENEGGLASYIREQEDPLAFGPLDRSNLSLQATSRTPVNDDRIAALWTRDEAGRAKRTCTVNHLSGKFWLTAHHCVSGSPDMLAYIEQSDGEVAGVENIYLKSGNDDVALLKVGRGITATTFDLPEQKAAVGDTLTLIGYGRTNDFSSAAEIEVTGYREEFDFGQVVYRDLLEGTSLTPSRSCEGDSGGALFAGDTIYAVHTASGSNLACRDGEGALMWHTNLAGHREWIEATMAGEVSTTEAEHRRAFEGLGEKTEGKVPDEVAQSPGSSLSSGSALSSS